MIEPNQVIHFVLSAALVGIAGTLLFLILSDWYKEFKRGDE